MAAGCRQVSSREADASAGFLCCRPGCWSQATGLRALSWEGATTKAGVPGVQKPLPGAPQLYSRVGWREEVSPPPRPLREITAGREGRGLSRTQGGP